MSRRSRRWDQRLGEGWVLTVVDCLELCWGEICAGGVQPAVVVPVDPFEGCELDVVEVPPRPARESIQRLPNARGRHRHSRPQIRVPAERESTVAAAYQGGAAGRRSLATYPRAVRSSS